MAAMQRFMITKLLNQTQLKQQCVNLSKSYLVTTDSAISCGSANIISVRKSSFLSSPQVRPIEEYPEVEIVHNAPEWKYVERLLPAPLIPKPIAKNEYPSGWKPPKILQEKKDDLKYFVARTKNHMIPVYLKVTFRGQRRVTVVRLIQGDIWALEQNLRNVVEKARNGKLCASRVNEMSGQIYFHGDYVDLLRDHLKAEGF